MQLIEREGLNYNPSLHKSKLENLKIANLKNENNLHSINKQVKQNYLPNLFQNPETNL